MNLPGHGPASQTEVMIVVALRHATVSFVIGEHGPQAPTQPKFLSQQVRNRYAESLHQLFRITGGSLAETDLHEAFWAMSSASRHMVSAAWKHMRIKYPHLPELPHRPRGRPTKEQASAGLGGKWAVDYKRRLRWLVERGATPTLLAGSLWKGYSAHHLQAKADSALLVGNPRDQSFTIVPADGGAAFIGKGSDDWAAILVLRRCACVEGERAPNPESPLIPIRPGSRISATAELIREICKKNL